MSNDPDENPFVFAISGEVTLPPPEIRVWTTEATNCGMP